MRGLEASFAWIFTMIVGAAILFFAIYTASNIIDEGKTQTNAESAAQLVALLGPVETTLESGKYSVMKFSQETRVINKCYSDGTFGKQEILTQVSSGIGGKWSGESVPITFENKYFFSQKIEETKELNILVKPLYLPYKVADLIVASGRGYCFIDAPSEVKDDIEDLGAANIKFFDEARLCNANDIKVCFEGNCDVVVDMIRKSVRKGNEVVYFDEGLIYAAIMSDPKIYDCQVERLMKRAAEIGDLYARKAELIDSYCPNNLGSSLREFSRTLSGENSLGTAVILARNLEGENEKLSCKVF